MRIFGINSTFCVIFSLASLPSASLAQETGSSGSRSELDSHLPSSNQGIRPSDGGAASGEGEMQAEGGSSLGLGRMYGGVSGSAGVHSETIAGPRKNVPEFHIVKKGDTLWDLSNQYYGSPWSWPQVWSLNPQIENPHWIYPGDQVRTVGVKAPYQTAEDGSAGRGGFVGRERMVPGGTVFVRDQGYIGDSEEDVWGEIAGAHRDNMLLTEGNTVYLLIREDVELQVGQRLTVFKAIADAPSVKGARKPPGKIVKIYGTVRVDGWDKENRIAKGSLIESIAIIERGFKVGPVGRRFDVVPPRAADADVEARILTSLYPHVYFGKDQLVFIDKGSDDGLVAGNRLRALRRGDTWRRKLKTADHHARMRLELSAPGMPQPEVTPLRGDDDKFPDEVVGELTILRTEEYSSICLVTASTRGLMAGERVVAVKGY